MMVTADPDILHSPFVIRRGRKSIDLSSRTHVMGVLNVTPDSFSDGGKFFSKDRAVAHALQMVSDGADIIDVGGESTRPKGPYGEGAEVSAGEEILRVVPVIEAIASRSDVLISIDTYKSAVAEAALKAGAAIVNDISGLSYDPAIAPVTASHGAALIVMHSKGTPKTMQQNPVYENVVGEVKESLFRSVEKARDAGVENILIDPGIGFGKKLEHNLSLIKNLPRLAELHCPIVIGPSRKAFIGMLLNLPVDQRVEGTGAAVAASIVYGANIVRVHDVKEMKRIAVVVDAIMKAA
jgi:dihydropteroate synthase